MQELRIDRNLMGATACPRYLCTVELAVSSLTETPQTLRYRFLASNVKLQTRTKTDSLHESSANQKHFLDYSKSVKICSVSHLVSIMLIHFVSIESIVSVNMYLYILIFSIHIFCLRAQIWTSLQYSRYKSQVAKLKPR